MKNDSISRQAAKDYIDSQEGRPFIGCTIGEAMKIMLDEVPPAQPSVSKIVGDTISRQAAIKAICEDGTMFERQGKYTMTMAERKQKDADILDTLPPAQPESCEYYALCRHGRDENKLRACLGFCEYCNEDADGYVKPLEKNCHAFIRFGMNGWEIDLSAKGWHGSAKIRYCPMCGRKLMREGGQE